MENTSKSKSRVLANGSSLSVLSSNELLCNVISVPFSLSEYDLVIVAVLALDSDYVVVIKISESCWKTSAYLIRTMYRVSIYQRLEH